LAEEAAERLLFWFPHQENNDTNWREILYGILSLNRLSMHCSQEPILENNFGMSVQTGDEPEIQATSIRVALSIIHCLMPTFLEIIPNNSLRRSRQTRLRLRLEQLKFVLRLYLMVSYWKQFSKSVKSKVQPDIGVLRRGGMFDLDQGPGLTMADSLRLQRRRHYVGRRTGLTLAHNNNNNKTIQKQSTIKKLQLYRSILGELLHIIRPLYWASTEANHSANDRSLLKSWISTLVMDLASLRLLADQRHSGNQWAIEEWNRRKQRLLLYLLRTPVFSRLTGPALEQSSEILKKIPLLGQVIDVCLWDWILYWKLPYVAEEG
jgi:hypothetical protein